jgi:hypothetical protein
VCTEATAHTVSSAFDFMVACDAEAAKRQEQFKLMAATRQ